MMRKSFAAIILVFLLLALPFAATAEGRTVATPTDLDCLHEHTRTTIYFYDSPAYTAISATSHRVSGPASIRTVCLDCGEVLKEETADNAEEFRPHSFKNGVCALCGYRRKGPASDYLPADLPGERTLFAQEIDGESGLMILTLTEADLDALERANVVTALVRSVSGQSAVALNVAEIRDRARESGASLYLEIAEREDGSFFAGLFLIESAQEKTELDGDGVTLRFYRDKRTDTRITLAPADEDRLVEAEGVWDEHGFWSVQYTEEGTYFLLQ